MEALVKPTINANDFLEESDKLLEIAHNNTELKKQNNTSSILKRLLNCIEKINFQDYTKIKGNTKLKKNHFLVSVIEILIQTAHDNGFSLCRKYGFVYVFNGEYWEVIEKSEFEYFLGEVALKM